MMIEAPLDCKPQFHRTVVPASLPRPNHPKGNLYRAVGPGQRADQAHQTKSVLMWNRIWILIVCAALIMGLSMGFRQSLGLFLSPITSAQGLGREAFALAMGLMNLVWGLASPLAGAVADRYGAGRVVYDSLGHDAVSLQQPDHARTLRSAVAWALQGERAAA